MGYNFLITAGQVQVGHEVLLLSDLARLAMQLELPWYPVNAMVSGEMVELELCRDLTPESSRFPNDQPIRREWLPIETTEEGESARFLTVYKSQFQCEILQGITISHPYQSWDIHWNVTHARTLAQYSCRGGNPCEADECGRLPTRVYTISEIAEFMNQPATVKACGSYESRVDLHVPWTRSDVVAAVDALRIVEKHANGLAVQDDYHVWERGIDNWRNLTSGYVKKFKMEAVWPDATTLLDPDPDGGSRK